MSWEFFKHNIFKLPNSLFSPKNIPNDAYIYVYIEYIFVSKVLIFLHSKFNSSI